MAVNQATAIKYVLPRRWIQYDFSQIAQLLVEAKALVKALTSMPYQRDWVAGLQAMQLKREVAGTSRIEGADFTDHELEAALKPNAEKNQLKTRSQRQAHSAVEAYRWIATLADDVPIDQDLIKEIHRRIVWGCDDDHCPPGQLRGADVNVVFGMPRHRGCEGGKPCRDALHDLVHAMQGEYRDHDPLVQALAAHYHFAAMHPFLDGNGRTARALEALMLQRADLTDRAFIAMSNYYYDEKETYLRTLSEAGRSGHDLTPFLKFGLKGISIQALRLYDAIQRNMQIVLFKNLMYELFNRLNSPKKRVIKERQIEILKVLLDSSPVEWPLLCKQVQKYYGKVDFNRAIVRDATGLLDLGAIVVEKQGDTVFVSVNLLWPQEITESDFFKKINALPKSKTHSFLR